MKQRDVLEAINVGDLIACDIPTMLSTEFMSDPGIVIGADPPYVSTEGAGARGGAVCRTFTVLNSSQKDSIGGMSQQIERVTFHTYGGGAQNPREV